MSQRTPLGVVRVLVAYVFVTAILWISRPSPLLILAGAVLVAAGETIRFWAAGHLLKSQELAVSGPYRYTQNPLYLGRFLILTGFCIMAYIPLRIGGMTLPANILVLLVAYAVFFLYYIPRKVRVEGSRLREIHGKAWESYFRSVPILFPRLTPVGENVRSWEAGRMRRNREHWMLMGVALVTILFALKAYLGGNPFQTP
jgi:protein-S-isoprenylcysteine O-methyltransferase Ste14